MSHPHQAFLDEFALAIKRLSPGVGEQVKAQAKKLHADLSEDPEATEEQIHAGLVTIGKAEFPYRRAYEELVGNAGKAELEQMVLDHVEPEVREKLKGYLAHGVSVLDLVKSELFERDFTAEERYQIQDGFFDGQEHVQEHGPKMLHEKKEAFALLVSKWQTTLTRMEEKIEELRAMAQKDKKWRAEILDKVKVFEEGFSVVERDPELAEIEKEIEYWTGVLES